MYQILQLKFKDNTKQTLHAKFYAFRVKIKRIRKGVKYAPSLLGSGMYLKPGEDRVNLTMQPSNAYRHIIHANLYDVYNWTIFYFNLYLCF